MLKLVKTIKKISILSLICCGISSFAIQPDNTINVLDYGAVGDGAVDSTTAIQNAIDVAKGNSAIDGVYFPVGTYKITSTITFKSGVSLHGEDSGVSLIKADSPVTIGSTNGGNPKLSDVNVEDLFFKNIYIGFYAWQTEKRVNINIKRCVFSATSSAFDPSSSFISCSRTSDGSIQDCIFLRQKESPGEGIKTWKSSGLIVERNIIGLNLADTQWLGTQWLGATNWIAPDARIQEFKTLENLKDNQGHYRKGIDASSLPGIITIRQNIINGTEFISVWRDHVMYIHNNHSTVIMTQNWMRGWPNNPQGGLKIRNNYGPIIVAANRFKNTPIYGYIHRTSGEGGFDSQEVYIGTFVYRNIFDFDFDSPCYGGVGFWDQASEKGGLGVEENNEYAENTFNTPNNTASFWFRSAEASGHKIYVSNYHTDGTLVESSNQNIPLTIGVPDLEKTAPYEDLTIPEYDIPSYTQPVVEISEDAYIRGGSYASTNYNSGATMVIKGDSNNRQYDRKALLKVDLNQVEDIEDYHKVILNICTSNIVNANDTINAYFYNDNSWIESTVTYNDITDVTTPAIASVTSLATETWYELDITEKALEQIQNGNTVFTIILNSNGGYNKIYSSESGNKPFVKLR